MSRVLPILFNGDMVWAILEGRKTVTRRVVRQAVWEDFVCEEGKVVGYFDKKKGDIVDPAYKAPCQPGDILYVRETWSEWTDGYVYKTWTQPFPQAGCYPTTVWHPSIHMPKKAARIWLKVMDVRAERLKEIRNFMEEGIMLSEGCEECLAVCGECNRDETPIGCDNEIALFADLWDSTIRKADIDRYGWDADPWVWVIEFARCEKPEAFLEASVNMERIRK